MHLVDALTRMRLVASDQAAASVAFTHDRWKMTVLKGEAALAARRHVASTITPQTIEALRRKPDVEKPDFDLMQQLFDAEIRKCPVSGMPVFDPSACAPALRTALWRHYCGVADTINTKQMGQTDEALEELKLRLHEHAAQLREVAPRSRRLSRSDGTLAKRSRGASPTASLSDEATDTGAPVAMRRRRVIPASDDDEPMPMGSCAGLDDDELSALETDAHPPLTPPPLSPAPSPPSRSIVKRGKRPAAAAVSATQEIRQLHSYVDTAATELMCPIRHELPIDPVVAADGHIYEKAAIEGWLSRKRTSPMTNLAMCARLTPVICVKNAISELVCSGALDSDKAVEWQHKVRLLHMHRAAEGGDAMATFTLRLWYISGEWLSRMTTQEVARLNRAAEAGDAHAMFKLGIWYFKRGVRHKSGIHHTGEQLLWTAYVYGSDCACYVVGCLELYGLGSWDVQQTVRAKKCCFDQIPACNVKHHRWRAAMCFHDIPSCKFKQLRVDLKQEVVAWLRAEDAERDAMQHQLF